MKRMDVGILVSAVWMAALPGWAQGPAEEARQLRQDLERIQEKLKTLEANPSAKRRVTELTAPRLKLEEPQLQVRIYDVSDLFAVAPPYAAYNLSDFGGQTPLVMGYPPNRSPLFPSTTGSWSGTAGFGGMGMGGMGGMGGGMGTGGRGAGGGMFNVYQTPPSSHSHSAPAQSTDGTSSARTSIDDLIDAITSTITPEQWDAVGGPASINAVGNSLLVSATEPMHEQIGKLFDAFRQSWGTHRTVSVEAHWLWLTEPQLAAMLETAAPAGETRAFGLVNDAAWQKRGKEPAEPAGYHAVITCYNGQTVHVFSGGQKHFVSTLIPVVGDAGQDPGAVVPPAVAAPAGLDPTRAVGYQPQVSSVQEGAALQITPMVTVKGKYVVLDIHSRVIHVDDKSTNPRPVADRAATPMGSVIRDIAAAVDRPLMVNHHLETTLRVPADRRILVGGMTFDSRPKAADPSLFLFVKAVVQHLRDDQAETKTDVSAPKPAAERVRPKK